MAVTVSERFHCVRCSAAARIERQLQKARQGGGRRRSSNQSSQSALIESARKQLEASFGSSSGKTPWDSAQSSAQALDIIAQL